MTSQNPRDMREWMRTIERMQAQQRGVPSLIQKAVEIVIEDNEKDKTRHPAAPIELTFQTAIYTDTSSRKRVRFLLDFPDVVFNTDGTPTQIQQYELWAQEATLSALNRTSNAVPSQALPGATLPGLASTPTNTAIAAQEKPWVMRDTSTASFFRSENYIPGTVWRFRARAIGATTVTPGEWSETVTVQMLQDKTPPAQPTAPTLLVQRGTITASWNGQAVNGPMPADFKYAILAHGESSSPTFEIARFGRGGGFKVVADLDYYDPQFFRIQAVDESGNRSPWSEQAVGFTTPLVDKDIILSTIDAAKTHLKNIDAGVSILPNTIITEHLVVTEEMTAAIANFLVVNADMINVNSIWGDEAFFGMADALLFRGDAFEGKMFTGGRFIGGRFETDVEDYEGLKWDTTGLLAYSSSGVETFRLDAATGNLTANYGTLTGLKYQTHTGATTGIKIDSTAGIKSYNTSGQLNFSLTSTGAQFTGTVTSGFGAARAILSDAVYAGRPGVRLHTGTNYWAEPFITSFDATNPNSAWRGGLFASAAWTYNEAEPGRMLLSASGEIEIGGLCGTVQTFLNGTGQFRTPYGGTLYLGSGSSYLISATGGTLMQVESNGTATISATGGTTILGGLNVSGSKNFVMDHPTKPGMELLHGATESPVSGVEYWGRGVIGPDGTSVVVLPEYFSALVKPDTATIAVYGNGAVVGWGDVVDNSVLVTGPKGTKYSWLVKAERIGGDFNVEREKVEWMAPTLPSE